MSSSLSEDEHLRAERFRFAEHRERFCAARGILRLLLARYARVQPKAICFQLGKFGKPALTDGRFEVSFNVSHSGDKALFGFAKQTQIGVDLEGLRPMVDALDLAGKFFAPSETAVLSNCAEGNRSELFFRCWTRKEAFLKAIGEGLSAPLASFEVLPLDEPRARVRLLNAAYGRPRESHVFQLEPSPGWIGALAIPLPQPELRLMHCASLDELLDRLM